MLSRRDTLFLNKFLIAAYTDLGYAEPAALAKKTVFGLTASSTRREAVSEVVRRCDRAQYSGGVMRLRADLARDILAHYLSHDSDRADTRLWFGSPDESGDRVLLDLDDEFWEAYERRFRATAGVAAREAASLRLLDRCDPALLFSFYLHPDEGD